MEDKLQVAQEVKSYLATAERISELLQSLRNRFNRTYLGDPFLSRSDSFRYELDSMVDSLESIRSLLYLTADDHDVLRFVPVEEPDLSHLDPEVAEAVSSLVDGEYEEVFEKLRDQFRNFGG